MSNATLNNVSVISWRSVLLMKDTRVSSRWQTLSHNAVSSTLCLNKIWTHNVSGDRQWLQSYYHTITTTTAPQCLQNNRITNGNHRAKILDDYIVHLINHKKNYCTSMYSIVHLINHKKNYCIASSYRTTLQLPISCWEKYKYV